MFDTPLGVSVVDGGGETPGPIPNPEAKPARADGTAPGREWESRLPPTQQLHTMSKGPHYRAGLCSFPRSVSDQDERIPGVVQCIGLLPRALQKGPLILGDRMQRL